MRLLYCIIGILSLALGAVGAVLPILPTTPFLLLSAFCFTKSSKRLNDWFIQTKLYQKHLKDFSENRSMSLKTKLSLMTMVTVMLSIGFIMMKNVPVGRVILVIVWIFHVYYFLCRIKTVQKEEVSSKNNTV